MIIYRPHRELLYEALEEMKEFETIDEMKQYISKSYEGSVQVEDIFLDKLTVKDDRIGWNDTRYVCTRKLGNDDVDEMCIGMCATDYDYDKTVAYLKEQKMIEREMVDKIRKQMMAGG